MPAFTYYSQLWVVHCEFDALPGQMDGVEAVEGL